MSTDGSKSTTKIKGRDNWKFYNKLYTMADNEYPGQYVAFSLTTLEGGKPVVIKTSDDWKKLFDYLSNKGESVWRDAVVITPKPADGGWRPAPTLAESVLD